MVAHTMPISIAFATPRVSADDGRPGDRGAVPPGHRDAGSEQANRRVEPEQEGSADAGEIPHEHESHRDREQHREQLAATHEIADVCVDADDSEEIDEQDVARRQFEVDFDAGEKIHAPNAAENRSPPVTGSGMLYSRRTARRWLSILPTKSTMIPAVTDKNGAQVQHLLCVELDHFFPSRTPHIIAMPHGRSAATDATSAKVRVASEWMARPRFSPIARCEIGVRRRNQSTGLHAASKQQSDQR